MVAVHAPLVAAGSVGFGAYGVPRLAGGRVESGSRRGADGVLGAAAVVAETSVEAWAAVAVEAAVASATAVVAAISASGNDCTLLTALTEQ